MRRLVQRLEKMRKEMREMSIDFVLPSLKFIMHFLISSYGAYLHFGGLFS